MRNQKSSSTLSNSKKPSFSWAKRAAAFSLALLLSLGTFDGLSLKAQAATELTPTPQQEANSAGYPEIFEPETWSEIERRLDWGTVCETNSDVTSAISDGSSVGPVFAFQIQSKESTTLNFTIPNNDVIYLIGNQTEVPGTFTITVNGKAVMYGSDFSAYSDSVRSSVTVKNGGVLVMKETDLSAYNSITVESGGCLYLIDSDVGHGKVTSTPTISCYGFLSVESSNIHSGYNYDSNFYSTAYSSGLTVQSTGYVEKLRNITIDRLDNSGYIKLIENMFIDLNYWDRETCVQFGGLFNNAGGQIETIVGGAIRGTQGLVNKGTIGVIRDMMAIQATGLWTGEGEITRSYPAIDTTSPIEFEYVDGPGTLLVVNKNASYTNSVNDASKLVLAEGNECMDMIGDMVNITLAVSGHASREGGGSTSTLNGGGGYAMTESWKGTVIGDKTYAFTTPEGRDNVYANLTVDRIDASQITLKWADLNSDPNHLNLGVWRDSDLKYGFLEPVWEKKADAWYGVISDLTPGKTYTLGSAQYATSNARQTPFANMHTEIPDFEDSSIKLPVKSINPESPVVPTLDSCTDTSITLTAQDGYEYSSNGGSSYQDSPTFTGLTAGTKYSFVQRIKENETYLASDASAAFETYTRPAAPAKPELSTKTDTTIQVTVVPGQEYSLNSGEWQSSGLFEGLTPNTEYNITTRIVESGEIPASMTSAPLSVTTDKTKGEAPGEITTTVTDVSISIDSEETYEYKLDKEHTSYQSETTFTGLTPETEYTITYRRPETETHSASSEKTVSITTKKAAPATPDAPVLESRTDTTLTIQAVPGCEYSKDGEHWQDENVFTDLEPGTSYDIYVRTKAEEDQMQGESSHASFTTKNEKPATPSAPELESKTDIQVVLKKQAGYEYSKDGSQWQDDNVFDNLTPDTDYTFYVRVKETDDTMPSDVSEGLSVRTKQKSPVLELSDLDVLEKTDTMIRLDLPEGYEIKIDDGLYQDSGEFTDLTADTEYTFTYRLKETDTSMASNEHSQTVRTKKSAENAGTPEEITLISRTDTSITINVPAGQEVKLSTGEYQDSGLFENLTADTEYTFLTRLKATDDAMPSVEGEPLIVRTKKNDAQKPLDDLVVLDRTDTSITVQVPAGEEVKIEDGAYQTSGVFEDLTPGTDYTFSHRVAETEDTMPSEAATQVIRTKKSAVTVEDTKSLSLQDKTDASISLIVPEGQEVRLSTGDWQDSGEFAGLKPDTTYSFDTRVKETEDQIEGEILSGFQVTTKRDKDHAVDPDDCTQDNTLTPPDGTEVSIDDGHNWTDEPVDVTDVEKDDILFRAKQPELESATDVTLTVKSYDLIEYSKDGSQYQDENTFTGLTPDTEYSITARIKETDENEVSDPSQALSVRTLKSAAPAPDEDLVVLDRTDVSISFELPDDYEIKLESGDYQDTGLFENLNPDTEYTFIYRIKGSVDTMPSATREQVVSTKRAGGVAQELILQDKTDVSVILTVPEGQEVKLSTGEYQDSGEFTGLTPDTSYEFVTRVKETDDQEPSRELAGFTVTTKRDKDHAFDLDDVTDDSNILTPPPGTEVSVDGGENWTDKPVDVTDIDKDDILFRPSQPVLLYVTDTALAVESHDNLEYSLNDGAWQDSGSFTGLTPDTEYSITARIKETDENEASEKSQALTVRTLKTAPDVPVDSLVILDRTDVSISFELLDNYEIKLESGEYQDTGLFENLNPDTEYTFMYRIKGSADTMPSETRNQTVSTKKSGVDAANTKPLTMVSRTDVSITLNVPEGQEVRLADSETWQDSGEFTGLTQDTSYEFVTRVKETDDQEPGAELGGFIFSTKRDSWHAFDPDDLTDDNNILTPPPGAEVSIDNGHNWTDKPVDVTGVDKDDILFRPKKPELESKTDTTIVITPNENLEYSKEPGEYQDENEFTDLTPDTSYEIVVRFPETNDAMASEPSEPLIVETKDTAQNAMEDMTTSKPNDENPDNIDVTIPDGLEVSTDGGETWTDEDLIDVPKDIIDDLIFRVAAPKLESATTNTIILVKCSGLEYAIVTGDTYQWQDSAVFADLKESTKYTFVARLKETDDYVKSDVSLPAVHSTKSGSTPIIPEPDETEHSQYLYGYPGNKVMPESNLTREEAAALLYRVSGFKPSENLGTFPDVKSDRWSIVDVETLAENGIIIGYEDGTFRPTGKITRAEFVTMVINLVNLMHPEARLGVVERNFSDLTSDHWAYDFIQEGVNLQWLSGYEDNTFRPDNNITRAEAIVILNRMLGRGNCEHLDGLKNPWIDLQPKDWYYDDLIEATVTHKF